MSKLLKEVKVGDMLYALTPGSKRSLEVYRVAECASVEKAGSSVTDIQLTLTDVDGGVYYLRGRESDTTEYPGLHSAPYRMMYASTAELFEAYDVEPSDAANSVIEAAEGRLRGMHPATDCFVESDPVDARKSKMIKLISDVKLGDRLYGVATLGESFEIDVYLVIGRSVEEHLNGASKITLTLMDHLAIMHQIAGLEPDETISNPSLAVPRRVMYASMGEVYVRRQLTATIVNSVLVKEAALTATWDRWNADEED